MEAKAAAQQIVKAGYALLGPVLAPDLIERLNADFNQRYPGIATATGLGPTLLTGDRRHMITVELGGAFGDPQVYANPAVLEVLRIVLEDDFVLQNFGLVVSLPGAKSQHRHRDGGFLFRASVAAPLPAHAVTVCIPLIDMNAERGTTEVLPSSHRAEEWDVNRIGVAADIPAGGCLMFDYRTVHRGTANQSQVARPLMYATYARPWWRDLSNFRAEWGPEGPVQAQAPLLASREFLAALPAEHRPLFRQLGRAQGS